VKRAIFNDFIVAAPLVGEGYGKQDVCNMSRRSKKKKKKEFNEGRP
jgi:hypothetical protein